MYGYRSPYAGQDQRFFGLLGLPLVGGLVGGLAGGLLGGALAYPRPFYGYPPVYGYPGVGYPPGVGFGMPPYYY